MPDTPLPGPHVAPRLRLWPGVVAALVFVAVRVILPSLIPEAAVIAIVGGFVCAVAIVVWWLVFSRAPILDRVGTIVLMVIAIVVASRLVHPSISNGMMGMLLPIYAFPSMAVAVAVGALIGSRLGTAGRRVVLAVAVVIACGVFTMLRTDGIIGAGSQFAWRWTPSSEERLLARADDEPRPVVSTPAATAAVSPPAVEAPPVPAPPHDVATAPSTPPSEPSAVASPLSEDDPPPQWPGFRGSGRDGVARGVAIDTDWNSSPPVAVWRRAIGPGWSSFAVRDDVLYTQEQRGEEELVSAYKVSTGEPVWRHRDPVRFWESNGGAGPRATPTLSHGRVYSFGATGILNALDAASGTLLWSHNVATDTRRKVPDWGFASSPLIVEDDVIVAASGTLAAYNLTTGQKRWIGPQHGNSYSSPQLATIDGVPQIVLLHGAGATSVSPRSGAVLWEYDWPGSAIVQPAVLADGGVLINSIAATGGAGIRRLAIARAGDKWSVSERWTSTGLKPYYNDFVVHKGHAYGFDGSILSCIDLEDGARKWKGGRYGSGQLMLLPDQDLLLVVSEDGDLALVSATPEQFKEIVRVPAIQGKTWNHPVIVGDMLLVRNGEEMAAFRVRPLRVSHEAR